MAIGLAALLPGKGKGPAMGGEEPPASGPAPIPAAENDYGAELAEQLGVKDAAAFTESLKGFVRACMSADEAGEYEEEA